MAGEEAAPRPVPMVCERLEWADLRAALAAGWRDFLACPQFGLFFAIIYAIAGNLMSQALLTGGGGGWIFAAAAGFPLLAPFTAVGLYEASRQREQGQRASWSQVLGALRGQGDDQILMMGGFLFVGFSFWMILAHGIFAIFMAESGIGTHSLDLFTTPAGLAMLVVGGAVGAVVAYVFFASTVVSLPTLVDREIDFLTATFASLRLVGRHRTVMLGWAAIVAVLLTLALLPWFLGLLVALPVLGHATWHLYRRAITFAG